MVSTLRYAAPRYAMPQLKSHPNPNPDPNPTQTPKTGV